MRLSPLTAALGALLLAAPLAAQAPTSRPKVTKVPPSSTPDAPATKPTMPHPPAARPASPGAAAAGDGFGYLQGVAVDSIHGGPLVNAVIQLEGTDRVAVTDSLGRFLADSIKPGSYKVFVDHPVVDTLGILLSTAPMQFVPNEVTRVIIAVPSPEFLAGRLCPAARRALGPGVLVGRVRDPDTEMPAIGARVSLVWYDPDPPAIAGLPVKVDKAPRVREATVGEDGTYRLCGLPEKYEGKLQAQRKDGGTTAEVPVTQDGGVLAMRSMTVAPAPRAVAAAPGDSAAAAAPAPRRGTARVIGRVTNKSGAPVSGARVSLLGNGAATITKTNGEFALDSLPAGTQAISVRHLGYAPKEVPVELSARVPFHVNVELGDYVPELAPVEVVSRMEQGLERVGFTERKRGASGGYFLGPDQIEARKATQFTDYLTTTPGIRVQGVMGHMYITSTRGVGGSGSCVRIYVDGNPWQQMEPGDLDAFVTPSEVAAIEVYPAGAQTPVEFQSGGQDCATVVAWTKVNVNRRAKK